MNYNRPTREEIDDPNVETKETFDWKGILAGYAVFFVLIGWAASPWLHALVIGILLAANQTHVKTNEQVRKEIKQRRAKLEEMSNPKPKEPEKLGYWAQLQKEKQENMERDYEYTMNLFKESIKKAREREALGIDTKKRVEEARQRVIEAMKESDAEETQEKAQDQ